MKIQTAAIAATLLFSSSFVAPASAQTFDFEGAAVGSYSSLSQTVGGVTLNLSRQGGKQFRIRDLSEFSVPNFGKRTLDPFNDTTSGAFIADFSNGLSGISISLGDFFADDDTLTLSIYSGLGGTGTLLGTQTVAYPSSQGFSDNVGLLSLSSASAFRSAVFNGGSASFPNSVFYDNLVVSLAGGVPEPATWALMILGFGAVGAAMRRRQPTTAKIRLA